MPASVQRLSHAASRSRPLLRRRRRSSSSSKSRVTVRVFSSTAIPSRRGGASSSMSSMWSAFTCAYNGHVRHKAHGSSSSRRGMSGSTGTTREESTAAAAGGGGGGGGAPPAAAASPLKVLELVKDKGLQQPDGALYSAALLEAVQKRRFHRARAILAEARSSDCDWSGAGSTSLQELDTCALTITEASRSGAVDLALELLADLVRRGQMPPPGVTETVLQACQKPQRQGKQQGGGSGSQRGGSAEDLVAGEAARAVEEALGLRGPMWGKLNKNKHGARATWPDVHAPSPSAAAAAAAVDRTRKSMSYPRTYSYNLQLRACSGRGGAQRAVQLLDEMRSKGIQPDAISYNTAIGACARAGGQEHRTALWLLSDMQRRWQAQQGEEGQKSRHPRPDAMSFAAAVRACAARHASSEALPPRPTAHDRGAQAQAKAARGRAQAALGLLASMQQGVAEGGPTPTMAVYAGVVKACAAGGQLRLVLSLLQEMRSVGMAPSPQVYNFAIMCCGSERLQGVQLDGEVGRENKIHGQDGLDDQGWGQPPDFKTALSLLEDMRSDGVEPNLLCYTSVMSVCGKAGQKGLALELLQEMQQQGGALQPDSETFACAIAACSQVGDSETALELLRVMAIDCHPPVRPSVKCYGAAIHACAKALEPRKARQLLNSMMEGMEGMEEGQQEGDSAGPRPPLPNRQCYNAAIGAFAAVGDSVSAVELMKEMEGRGLEPNSVTFNQVIRAYGNAKDADGAIACFRSMPKGRPYVLDTAVLACVKAGEHVKGAELLAEMRGKGLRGSSLAYEALIHACGEAASAWQAAAAGEEEEEEEERHLVSDVEGLVSDARQLGVLSKGVLEAAVEALLLSDVVKGGGGDHSDDHVGAQAPRSASDGSASDGSASQPTASEGKGSPRVLFADALYREGFEKGFFQHWAAAGGDDAAGGDTEGAGSGGGEGAHVMDVRGFSVGTAIAALRHVCLVERKEALREGGLRVVMVTGGGRHKGRGGGPEGEGVVQSNGQGQAYGQGRLGACLLHHARSTLGLRGGRDERRPLRAIAVWAA